MCIIFLHKIVLKSNKLVFYVVKTKCEDTCETINLNFDTNLCHILGSKCIKDEMQSQNWSNLNNGLSNIYFYLVMQQDIRTWLQLHMKKVSIIYSGLEFLFQEGKMRLLQRKVWWIYDYIFCLKTAWRYIRH